MSLYVDARDTVPTPRTVAGVELRPFCLGHHLLLKACSLPFAGNAEADCGSEDVMLGVAICGLKYEETVDAMNSGEWPEIIARWRKRIAGPWWNPTLLDYEAIEEAFREHLRDGYAMPPIWKRDGAGGFSLSAPWELLLKNTLVRNGYGESEVLNGYLPARWHDYFTIRELDAAATCPEQKHWKPIFYTAEDHRMLHG